MGIVWPDLQIAHHPKAPLFEHESDSQLVLRQLMDELSSGRFPTTDEFQALFRQAGLVSLWFYLKFIAGFDGPYDLLNTSLHVDMCNFRQLVATTPGIKAAMLLPRASLKTTIVTHGPNGWELLRNPNLRIGCTSQIADRAISFVQTTIRTFTKNEFHQWLYPEYVKENRSDIEMTLENRTRRYPEPNLQAITAGGSTQGGHVDLFNPDDIVGEDMLNADHQSGAEMLRMTNWLYSNLKALVVSWKQSRVCLAGTRYSVDDPYERLSKESSQHFGNWQEIEEYYPVDPNGDWTTYYRPALEYDSSGKRYSINPDAYSVSDIEKLLETDPWLANSQYMNNPISAGIAEWSTYEVKDFFIDYDDIEETLFLCFTEDHVQKRVDIRHCDVVLAGDPSGGATHASLNSSRASAVLTAKDANGRYFILEAEAAFIEPTKFFDLLFNYKRKYDRYVRSTYVETQAGFKSFISILRKEQQLRGEFLNFLGIPALGNKETTIRNIIQPVLAAGKLFVRADLRGKVMEEVRVFPSKKMDLLDALKIAMFKSLTPKVSEDENDEDDERSKRTGNWRREGVSPITGY